MSLYKIPTRGVQARSLNKISKKRSLGKTLEEISVQALCKSCVGKIYARDLRDLLARSPYKISKELSVQDLCASSL